ncbi:MAG: metal-sensitive transcriptional regulator [Acidobacteriota bacterium]
MATKKTKAPTKPHAKPQPESVPPAAPAAPAAPAPRKAHAVDPSIKSSNLKRLNRIEGQVRGIARMVEEDRYCADIIVQVASVQEALRGVARELMRNHLRHCAAHAMHDGAKQTQEAMSGELLDLIYKHLR